MGKPQKEIHLADVASAYTQRAICDGGASTTLVGGDMTLLKPGTIKQLDTQETIAGIGDGVIYATHTGTIVLKSNLNGCKDTIEIDAYYTPNRLKRLLISTSTLDDKCFYCDQGGGGLIAHPQRAARHQHHATRTLTRGQGAMEFHDYTQYNRKGPVKFKVNANQRPKQRM